METESQQQQVTEEADSSTASTHHGFKFERGETAAALERLLNGLSFH